MAAAAVDVNQLHANSEIREVPLAELKVDRTYQRDPSQSLVDEIANNWDEVASELVLVSDRGDRETDGGLYIVNGQHRSLAASKLGKGLIWARVVDLTAVEDPGEVEASFRLKTNVRLGDRPLERFRAQVRAGDEQSIAIVNLLATFDSEINVVPQAEFGINSVATVEKLYRVDQGNLLRETLSLIRDAFGVVGGRPTTAATLVSISWFVIKHAEETDRSRIVEKIKDSGLAAWDRRARSIGATMGGSLWMNYYRALVDFYNERLSDSRKLEWRLKGSGGWGTRRNTYAFVTGGGNR
jgi:hypothetical protein